MRDWIDYWNVTQIKGELAANRTDVKFVWGLNIPKARLINSMSPSAASTFASLHFRNFDNSRQLNPDGSDCVGSVTTGNDLLHPFAQPTVPQPDVEDSPNPRDMVKVLN